MGRDGRPGTSEIATRDANSAGKRGHARCSRGLMRGRRSSSVVPILTLVVALAPLRVARGQDADATDAPGGAPSGADPADVAGGPAELDPASTEPSSTDVPAPLATTAPPATADAPPSVAVPSPLPSVVATSGDFEAGFTGSDGAYLRTRDRAWSIRLSLLWQFRGSVSSTPDPSRELEFVPVLERFALQGTLAFPWVRYFFQTEFAGQANPYPNAPVAEAPRLLDMWVEAQPHEAFGVRVGLMRPAFTRSWITGLQRMLMLDRTDANLFFRTHGVFSSGLVGAGGSVAGTAPTVPWDRDIGAMVFGTPGDGVFEYYVGVFNGNGFLFGRNEALSAMPMVRLVVNPLGRVAYDETPAVSNPHQPFRFQIGLAGYYNHYRATFTDPTVVGAMPEVRDEEQYTAAADITLQVESVYLTTELYYRNRRTVDGARHDEVGAMGMAGWMFVAPYLEAAARFSIVDPNVSIGGDFRGIYDIGVNVYPAGNNLRLEARYTVSLNDATVLGGVRAPRRRCRPAPSFTPVGSGRSSTSDRRPPHVGDGVLSALVGWRR